MRGKQHVIRGIPDWSEGRPITEECFSWRLAWIKFKTLGVLRPCGRDRKVTIIQSTDMPINRHNIALVKDSRRAADLQPTLFLQEWQVLSKALYLSGRSFVINAKTTLQRKVRSLSKQDRAERDCHTRKHH